MTTHPELADAGQTPETVSDNPIAQQTTGADTVNGDDAPPVRRARSRGGKNIILRVFPEEHDNIAERAAEAGLSVSEFIRRIALGYKTQSRFDYDVIEHLIKIHTDMNRLGNLFKMSLKQDGDGNGTSLSYMDREQQRSVLQAIEDNQELLKNYIGGFNT
jgi:hypothetical protein